ncbi:MAG TPA: hypothetical protein VFX03_08750, partial [Thermomicrobiales bacterium]|nr:hypothetical protein [Thermomicrobiales bacterium]
HSPSADDVAGEIDDAALVALARQDRQDFAGPVWEMFRATPSVPVAAALRRLTLAPGASISAQELPGLEAVSLESGTLDAAWGESASAAMSSPTQAPQPRSGGVDEPLPLD